jgi:TonB family protein
MLFRRLIERPSLWTSFEDAEGYLFSFFAHVALIGGVFFGTRHGVSLANPDPMFTPVQYLIPKDRLAGSRPTQEHIIWNSMATVGGEGQREVAKGDKELIKFVKEQGTEMDEKKAEERVLEIADALGDSIMTELQVDSVALRYENSAAPPYPESMLKKHIEGSVVVQYVVDTLGRADTTSFTVLFATHRDFAQSVKNTLPQMRFRPAIMASVKVKQLVQQPFAFKILDTTAVAKKKG